MNTTININKNRFGFESFIQQQNATELLHRVDSIGYVGLNLELATVALSTQNKELRIYSVYPINGGEISFSNKIELGIALLKLRHNTA